MILFELTGSEGHPVYSEMEVANGHRHYSFLRSMVQASLATQRPFLSAQIIKALNYHAIVCLHTNAGEYRPCNVSVGSIRPPPPHSVDALMDDLINHVNRWWGDEKIDVVVIAAYVLWRLNYIHPFINGNGRTARAACYFVLCVSFGHWLPGKTILPELLREYREDYVRALRVADEAFISGNLDLSALHALILRLLAEQMGGTKPNPPVTLQLPAP